MTLGIIDISTIVIVIILIMGIIVINLTNLINKKLTGISVSIPPIDIPDPNITVKIQKNCESKDDDNYKIFIEKNNPLSYSLSPRIENTNENFTQVSSEKKQGYFLNPVSENCSILEQETKRFNSQLDKVMDEQYNTKQKSYISPEVINILNDKKINKRFLNDAYKYMIENDLYTKKEYDESNRKFINDNRNINEDDFDPNIWYKKFQVKVPTYLEDPETRGYNLNSFGNFGNINSVGKISLTDNYYKNPRPSGTLFNNSVTNLR